MANNNSKNKTNNKKNNTKKVDASKKVNETKKTNTTKKVENNNKKVVKNNTKKEVKKVTPKEEIKVEQIVEEVVDTEVKKEKKSFSLTSKQKDLLLVLLVAVVLVIALVITGGKEPKLDIELPIALEGEAGFTEITYSEYEEKLNTEAPFVVVIVKDGCVFCEKYKPVVESVANEYALPIYFINLSNLTSEEQSALASSNTYLKKENWGTPTTLFMYGNKVVDLITEYVEKDAFESFVKENFVVE
jgi:predicted bacteriocin transport accessory protein